MSNVRNALERAIWLYERCGLIAGTIEGDPMAAYGQLWESINGAGSWADNPWIWVVEFRKL